MLDDLAADESLVGALPGSPDPRRPAPMAPDAAAGLLVRRVDDLDLVVVSKPTPGLGEREIAVLHGLVDDLASGRGPACKFLVLDFASEGAGAQARSPRFEALVEDLSNLIFRVPVVSVAWIRRDLSGVDLELALACSMLVGEAEARLAFDLDLVESLRTYALLAHKLGFVQAERLMEDGASLSAAAAHDLLMLHSVVPSGEGLEGIRRFVASRMRRHNSACGLYRAQRITMLRAE